jgi:hypothetical protein
VADPLKPVEGRLTEPLARLVFELFVKVTVRFPPAHAAAIPLTVKEVIATELSTVREYVNPSESQAPIEPFPAPTDVDPTPRLAAAAKVAAAAVKARTTKTGRGSVMFASTCAPSCLFVSR